MTTTTFAAPPFASMFAKPEEVGDPKSIILYGAPGTWKTTTAGSIVKVPKFANARVLYIDIDNGSEVFVNDPDVYKGVQEGRINIVQIDKLDPAAYNQLRYFLGGDDEFGQFTKGTDTLGVAFDPQWGYDIVILDALDVAQEVAAEWFIANTFAENGKPNTMKAWGEIGKWTTDMAWALQNHPTITGILVMHSKEGADESGRFSIKPKLSGSAKDSIAGIPSLVVHLGFEADPNDKNNVQLVATLGKSDIMVTKNRYRLDPRIVNFDLPTFYALIDERKAETRAAIAAKPTSKPTAVPATPAATAA